VLVVEGVSDAVAVSLDEALTDADTVALWLTDAVPDALLLQTPSHSPTAVGVRVASPCSSWKASATP